LQENLISLLAYDDEVGRLISQLVNANLFEGEYRDIAEQCIRYWQRHQQAPKLHTTDLFAEIIDDPGNKKAPTFQRIISQMAALHPTINKKYIVESVRTFTRMQRFKDAILRSAEQINKDQELAISEIEKIWNDLLRVQDIDFQLGMRLTEIDRVLNFLATQYNEFKTGIPELDQNSFVPFRQGVMLMLAPPGAGKSWWLVTIGKMALLLRKRVLHISLEMSEEECALRYYMALYAAPKRSDKIIEVTTLNQDDGKLEGFGTETITPDFTFESSLIGEELEAHLLHTGRRIEGLIIKRFPPRRLSPQGLRAYLDGLELTEKFIPDMIILDYMGIMETDIKQHRLSLGRVFEEFRAICVERNAAGVTAQQVNRQGADNEQGRVEGTHIAEDFSMTGTADMIVT
jgi:hypothetical protein